MLLGVLSVLVLNIISSTTGVLNTILISKRIMKPVYIVMFFDAIVFTTGIRLVSNGKSFYFILAYACGKVIGAFVANKIEEKLALGILEVSVYAKPEKAFVLADGLREMGYGVTTVKGYGAEAVPRFTIDITIKRKELNLLKAILIKHGYNEATMVVKEIRNVSGKIKTTHKEAI
jgi:uncharacterized protein YebE (UPF0316 family)